jgi:hypothetical protein
VWRVNAFSTLVPSRLLSLFVLAAAAGIGCASAPDAPAGSDAVGQSGEELVLLRRIPPISLGGSANQITLLSGDNAKGGYDFDKAAYLGLSGGDLYFYGGAFWANNYDERGVVNLGPCSSADDVTTLPNMAAQSSRFNVGATVGNCYASRLHADNRQVAVFHVDALGSTPNVNGVSTPSVSLTWRLMPMPVPQIAWQHCEAYNAPGSIAPTTTASVLSSWLAANPSIKSSMQWILPVAGSTPQTVGYVAWPSAMQNQLLQSFVDYWAWYAAGMTGPDPSPVADPPPNQHPTSTSDVTTVLAPGDAQALYVKYLALGFVVELQHRVPWSLLQFDGASLAELLDARKFYTQYTTTSTGGGYQLISLSVVPAPPLQAAQFVASRGMRCDNKPESIAEVVFWARNLQHYNNTANPAQDEVDFWQYPGNPPASRVLAGTTYTGPVQGVPKNPTQWTLGCHGTTGLIKSLLRTINIPVEEMTGGNPHVTEPNNAFYFSGHATAHFLSEGLWLSHGDDPYIGSGYEWMLPFPLQALEINDAQFYSWFPNTGPSSTALPIGRQPNEIWIHYGDQTMLEDRLKDLTTQPTPPDANICGYIGNTPSPPNNYYSCSTAEAAGLLSMLDPLVTPYVTSGSLQQDLGNVPYYWVPEAQFLAPPCNTCVPAVCAKDATCCNTWSNHCETLAWQTCNNACIY